MKTDIIYNPATGEVSACEGITATVRKVAGLLLFVINDHEAGPQLDLAGVEPIAPRPARIANWEPEELRPKAVHAEKVRFWAIEEPHAWTYNADGSRTLHGGRADSVLSPETLALVRQIVAHYKRQKYAVEAMRIGQSMLSTIMLWNPSEAMPCNAKTLKAIREEIATAREIGILSEVEGVPA